jgi:Flp pilus assembly protein TadG
MGWRRKCKAMAIVEFSLVVPMFLLLCLAGVDFARVFQSAMTITGATRAGLEYASGSSGASNDTTGIANTVKAAAGNLSGISVASSQFCTCSLGSSQVSCTNSCSGKTAYIQVTTTIPFTTASGWPWVPNTLSVTSSGSMRVQ